MSWVVLFLAGVLEVVWAVGLKVNGSDPRPWLTCVTVAAIGASLVLLAMAMKEIPLGTAYAVWTGIGTVGAFIIGGIVFLEPLNFARILSAICVVAGIVGLKFTAH